MAISAQTLFHFTEYKYLKKIIKAKAFYPRLSFEEFMCIPDKIVALPMVCFCDIPLSQIAPHANNYHRNGIGLKKQWGVDNELNPVFYLQNGSFPAKSISEIHSFVNKMIFAYPGNRLHIKTDDTFLLKKSLELAAFFKPRKGRVWDKKNNNFLKYSNNNVRVKEIDFYDEREWRFVPKVIKEEHQRNIEANYWEKEIFYKDDTFQETIFKELCKKYEQFMLSFTTVDIKYIVVQRENYIQFLANFIHGLDESIYDENEKNMLVSKIISLKQIKEDF